jgi:hypothetical protein
MWHKFTCHMAATQDPTRKLLPDNRLQRADPGPARLINRSMPAATVRLYLALAGACHSSVAPP